MTTTTQLRSWWAPACTGPFVKVDLYGDGAVSVRPDIVPAVKALDACLRAHSYETRAADTGAYNCRKITGGTGYSLHAYGIALDLNWQSNPYGPTLITDMPKEMVKAIKAIRTVDGVQVWRWGGDYAGNKDAMHFEIVCSPAQLARGIAATTEEPDMDAAQDARLKRVEALLSALVPDTPRNVNPLTGALDPAGKPAALIWRWTRLIPTLTGVDEKALAAELAPLLTDTVPTLSDADLARVAKAVNDEHARRQAA